MVPMIELHDPQHNLVFSVHMYEQYGGATGRTKIKFLGGLSRHAKQPRGGRPAKATRARRFSLGAPQDQP
jgi:hypothetical protein